MEWHWLMKLYQFQVHNSVIQSLYIVDVFPGLFSVMNLWEISWVYTVIMWLRVQIMSDMLIFAILYVSWMTHSWEENMPWFEPISKHEWDVASRVCEGASVGGTVLSNPERKCYLMICNQWEEKQVIKKIRKLNEYSVRKADWRDIT